MNDKEVALLRKEYERVAPHLKSLPDLNNKIQSAVRNARSHISSATRVALATSLPNTRAFDGTVTVRSVRRVRRMCVVFAANNRASFCLRL